MKIPRKRHNHDAQPSRGTKRGRDEKQSDKTNVTFETPTHKKKKKKKKKKNATEEPPRSCLYGKLLWGEVWAEEGAGLKLVLLARNLTLKSDATLSYKYTVDSRYLDFAYLE